MNKALPSAARRPTSRRPAAEARGRAAAFEAKPGLQLTPTRLIVAGALCAAAAAASVMLRADLRAATARAALADAGVAGAPLEVREAAMERAREALAGPLTSGELRDLAADLALAADPPDLEAAAAHSHAALWRSPSRAHAWARLAYIDTLENGALSAQGDHYLVQSFLVEPFSPDDLRHWRLEFTFSYWRDLSPTARAAAVREAQAFAHEQPERDWMLRLAARLPVAPANALRDAVERGRELY